MGLIVLAYPFAEIYAFYLFIQAYSFLDALLFVTISGVLGISILVLQGKSSIQGLQVSLSQGNIPGNQLLNKAVNMLGGLLILVPGIISTAIGVLCVLPLSSHLIAWYLKKALARGFVKGRINVFTSGFGPRAEPSRERDATVVDVTPIAVTHTDRQDS